MTPPAYHETRRKAASPRWKAVADMRSRGMTYRAIAGVLGVSTVAAWKLALKWQDSQLNQPAP